MAAEDQLVEELNKVGIRVLDPPNSTPELVDLLDEVGAVLSKVGQKPSEAVKEALLPSMKGLIADAIFRNSDPDIKITVTACLNEIMRISAPVSPYDSGMMKDIFELIVSSFESLSTLHGRCYSKAVVILENVAKLRSCVMMLDLDCDPLITRMFELFLKNTSSDYPRSVLLAMETIMSVLIKESDDISHELLEVLLTSIEKENKDVSPASWKMGAKVIEECSEKLKPYIIKTMVSMGYSLDDYAPALSKVCKEEHDIVKSLDDDSSKDVVDGKLSVDERPSVFVQGLKAIDHSKKKVGSETDNKTTGHLRTKSGTNASKRAKNPNTHNLNESNGNSFGKAKATTDDKDTPRGDRTKKKGRQLNSSASRLSGNKENKSQVKDGSKSKSQKKQVFTDEEDDDDDDDDDAADNVYDDNDDDDDDDGPIETPYGRKNYKEDLIGARIKVWWPLDRRFYEGLISSYDASARKHKVNYDDGDKENLNLKEEKWEITGDELAADIDLKFDKKKTQPHSDRESSPTEGEEGTLTIESGPKSEDGIHEVSKTMGK